MLKKIVGKLWSKTPRFARLRIIRVTQKKFTASVAAVIFNENSEVLLLDHVLRPFSNWGLPGGFIDRGEQPEDAIKREIYEETGLRLVNEKVFKIRTLGPHIEIIFTAEARGVAEVKSQEIYGLGWFKLNEMPENMSSAQKNLIVEVLSKEN